MRFEKIFLITNVPGVTENPETVNGDVLRFTSTVAVRRTRDGHSSCSTVPTLDYFSYRNYFGGCSFIEFKRRSL